uniref:Uncharacterized protein n=1 Tax=Arundo donax TaxID=35708 RepID=A0A0A9B989_ARUDO
MTVTSPNITTTLFISINIIKGSTLNTTFFLTLHFSRRS